MVHIPEFLEKWEFYRSRAHLISPYFTEDKEIAAEDKEIATEDKKIARADVARRIPHEADAPLPASPDDGISVQAFGDWLTTKTLPDNRVRQWEELTRIAVAVWAVDLAGFERTIRHKAGEVLGWRGLVQTRPTRGRIRIRLEDRDTQAVRPGAELRFFQPGIDPDEVPRDVHLVWPGCIARIVVPTQAPKAEAEDRRAWLLAEYDGAGVHILDPVRPDSGPAPSSRIDRTVWRPDRREGHVVLPRGEPGHVWLPPSIKVGTRFDVFVLVLNLGPEQEEIRTLFDAIERRWWVSGREALTTAHQTVVRSTLDEAAALIDAHDILHVLHVQPCEVVDRATALGAAHG